MRGGGIGVIVSSCEAISAADRCNFSGVAQREGKQVAEKG
jgi:hypothetical protein